MRTDDFGHEIAPPAPRKSPLLGGVKVFLFGIALGAGLCVEMGPQLPSLDVTTSTANASEPGGVRSPPWLALGNALLDPAVTGASPAERQEAVETLHRRWLALLDALQDMDSDRIGAAR